MNKLEKWEKEIIADMIKENKVHADYYEYGECKQSFHIDNEEGTLIIVCHVYPYNRIVLKKEELLKCLKK